MATTNKTNDSKKQENKSLGSVQNAPIPLFLKAPWIISLLFVLSFFAALFSLYATYACARLDQRLADKITKSTQAFEAINHSQKSIKNELSSTLNSLNDFKQQLTSEIHALEKGMEAISKEKMLRSNEWILLKARYYLQLAQINAHWSNSLETTQKLLTQADELLTPIHEQRLFAVRQAIAKEVSQINAIKPLDITGILSQLDAASEKALSLPIKKEMLRETPTANADAQETASKTWKDSFKQSVNRLERLVIIRRHDADITPLLSRGQETMLRESIRLNLQEAQLAVLQYNPKVYKFALNQALQNIKRYFQEEAASVQDLITKLNNLKDINLEQTTPDVAQSLKLLNQLIENFNDDGSAPKGENT